MKRASPALTIALNADQIEAIAAAVAAKPQSDFARPNVERQYSPAEVAALRGCHVATVHRDIAVGRLPSRKIGSSRRIGESALRSYLAGDAKASVRAP